MGHENLGRKNSVKAGSERSFGIVFACFFAFLGLMSFVTSGRNAWLLLGVAFFFLVVAGTYPRILRPFNIAWFKFGLLLNAIVSPLVLGIMYYAVITPVGLLMRGLGKRPLNLDKKPEYASYWIKREPPAPDPRSFLDQF